MLWPFSNYYTLHLGPALAPITLLQGRVEVLSVLATSRDELHLDLNHCPSYPLMPILLSCEDKSDNNPPESSKTLQNPSISEEF